MNLYYELFDNFGAEAIKTVLLFRIRHPYFSLIVAVIAFVFLAMLLYSIAFPRKRLCKKCEKLASEVKRNIWSISRAANEDPLWSRKIKETETIKDFHEITFEKTTLLSNKGVCLIFDYKTSNLLEGAPENERRLYYKELVIKIGNFVIVEESCSWNLYNKFCVRDEASLKAIRLVISELKYLLKIKKLAKKESKKESKRYEKRKRKEEKNERKKLNAYIASHKQNP